MGSSSPASAEAATSKRRLLRKRLAVVTLLIVFVASARIFPSIRTTTQLYAGSIVEANQQQKQQQQKEDDSSSTIKKNNATTLRGQTATTTIKLPTNVTTTSPPQQTTTSAFNEETTTTSSSSAVSRPHPHAGARDANGNFGHVADVTLVRQWMNTRYEQYQQQESQQTAATNKNNNNTMLSSIFHYTPFDDPQEFNAICNVQPGEGFEGKAGWDLLVNHVKVHDNDSANQQQEPVSSRPPPSKGKILCVVYTYDGKKGLITGVTETWGWRCDGFFAASTKTVTDLTPGAGFGQIDLPHLGGESYNTMWQKTRSIMGYLYDNYMNEYDYFYLCGDDAHLIVENLRAYLGILEQEKGTDKPLMIGQHVRLRGTMVIGGGGGYVVNKAGLKLFAEKGLPNCEPETLISAEDRYLSNCMRELGAELVDTVDEQHRQRFHGLDADWMARENPWESNSWTLPLMYKLWEKEGHGRRWGTNVVSPGSVSFHNLKKPIKMKRHHAILYRSCPLGTVLGDALAKNDKAILSGEAVPSLSSFQDKPKAPHPHAGARDADGKYGYVADVTQVRRWMRRRYKQYRQEQRAVQGSSALSHFRYTPFNDKKELKICRAGPGGGFEGRLGWDILANRIQVHDGSVATVGSNQEPVPPPSRGKILCVVYTDDGKNGIITAITETWGWRCDGFFAASTKTETDLTPRAGFGQVDLPYGFGQTDLPHQRGEPYHTMWQKTRSIMGYLYDNYMDEYDYFFLCGHHTHLIVENLRAYLGVVEQEKGTEKPLMMGQLNHRSGVTMIGGGPGYVVNKAGLKIFAEKGLPNCEPTTTVAANDGYMSNCMRKLGVELVGTVDDQHRQRFHVVDRWGANVTSPGSVAFHNLKTKRKMKRHHAILYRSCPPGTVLGDALAENDK